MEIEKDNGIKEIDKAISELCYEKIKLIKAYRYYNGYRDPDQFRHLEENYGIGTPTSVEFIPLIRKHIDALVGEYLSINVNPKITCKDKKTLSNIFRDKQLYIYKGVFDKLQKELYNSINNAISGIPNKGDSTIEKEIEELKSALDKNFISEYEIAAQNIVEFIMQSRNIDFANKRKIMFLDLLIGGTLYYQEEVSESGTGLDLKVLNPINTFIEKNPNSQYLKDSQRAVIREYLSKPQILAKYGKYLSAEDLDILDNYEGATYDSANSVYLRSYASTVAGMGDSDGILGGYEVVPLLPYERTGLPYFKLYPVYTVEILKTDNKTFKMDRYKGTRIGAKIYIPLEKVETERSSDNPNVTHLSINGVFYSDRNTDPYSLIIATMNLQDKYDVLHFYRDNLLASSGTSGDWIDLAYVPKSLGVKLPERLMKWKAYKKGGLALIDSSQEGAPPLNTTFGGYDDTIKIQAVQAFELAIQRIEETCSSITGVFRERLGGIEQKDAVTNVQVGVRQSTYVTKQFFQLMDLMTSEVLLDSLNLAKVAFSKGISGTIILGNRLSKIFTALPKYYTLSDFDIHIGDSAEIIKEQQDLQQLMTEIIKAGKADFDILIDAFTAKSLTEMKESLSTAVSKKKEEDNQLTQMEQQLQQLSEQLKQLQQENADLNKELDSSGKEIENLRSKASDAEIKLFIAKNNADYNKQKINLDQKRVELEGAQLFDDNLRNDEIRNE